MIFIEKLIDCNLRVVLSLKIHRCFITFSYFFAKQLSKIDRERRDSFFCYLKVYLPLISLKRLNFYNSLQDGYLCE